MDPDALHPSDLRGALALLCPRCRAISDTDPENFSVPAIAMVPFADYLLAEAQCGRCGTTFDVCIWPFVRDTYSEEELGRISRSEENFDQATLLLLQRYLRAVERSHEAWKHLFAHGDRSSPVPFRMDLSAEIVIPITGRLSFMSPGVLATARGLRKAVSGHPERRAPGFAKVGRFRCGLTLDATPDEPLPYSVHLSVSKAPQLGILRPIEVAFLETLFFTPEERGSLTAQEGGTQHIIHISLPSPSPDVDRC